MKRVMIRCGRLSFDAELFDTNTGRMIVNESPLAGTTNVWGDEIYFPVSFTAELEKEACEEVEVGTLAYWPPGKAFCIFYGPTPVSTSSKPRAYSPVNIVGKIHGDLEALRSISDGEEIQVELMDED
jgi:hypothetical protein